MERYRFLFVGFLILSFLLSGCDGWLNVKPEDEIDEEELFSSGEGYRHALNGIYFTMGSDNLYGKQMAWGVVDALAQTYDYYNAGGVGEMSHGASKYDWEHDFLKPVVETMWNEAYNVVANCNQLVQRIEGADPEMFFGKERERSMIWGEALAIRAYLQFDMLRLFAPAPVTKPGERKFLPYVDTYPAYISYPKTVDECLTLLERDLKEAQKLLWMADSISRFNSSYNFKMATSGEGGFLSKRGYRLNYWATTAVLARFYLYAGKHAEALAEASKIITYVSKSNAFTFTNTTSLGDTKFHTDVIWGLHVIDLLKFNSQVNKMSDTQNPTFLAILEPETIFFGGDMYLKDVGNNIYTHMSNDRRFMTWVEDYNNQQYDYRFKKYEVSPRGVSADGDIANTLMPMIRMSEVYYIAAEASLNEAEGLANAKSYLDRVKKGRGLTASNKSVQDVQAATKDNFLQLLITDMRRDWLGEGQSFYIYKRLNRNIPAARSSEIKADEKVFVIPVPDVENIIK